MELRTQIPIFELKLESQLSENEMLDAIKNGTKN